MTNKARIALRDATYREPPKPERRCETCEHNVFKDTGTTILACRLSSERLKRVTHDAVCDAWEARRE